MIMKTSEKEENGILTVDFDCIWGGMVYGKLKLQFLIGFCYVHFTVEKWSHKVLTMIRHDLESNVTPFVKDRGYNQIIATFNKNTGDGNVKKWAKFIKLVGFPEPEPTYISILEV